MLAPCVRIDDASRGRSSGGYPPRRGTGAQGVWL